MRNLQKILALALALIMSFSLVVTANAAFSDEADINETYNESVNVLAQLEVFRGYTDGSYKPQDSITRAEVAAIIYRIATGDVSDSQVSLYSDWNRFKDVASGSWYAGYVNYCANAEYIKGYEDGSFRPNNNVTGYEALAMILRAVGYGKMDEFVGSNWAVNTAARANTLKISKNVTAALLGSPASREVVAELLFRSILVPTVTYNNAFGYQETDTTLGYDSFKLEQIEGVVVANEYANLYDTQVLGAGKTDFEIAKDDVRSLNIASELTAVGESHYAYVSGSTVYALENTGDNTVWEPENGKGTKVSDGLKAASLKKNDDTEFYLNFGREGNYTCDYRLDFSVTFETPEAEKHFNTYANVSVIAAKDSDYVVKDKDDKKISLGDKSDYEDVAGYGYPVTYTKIIRANDKIPAEDLDVMEGIFASADNIDNNDLPKNKVTGDVYVGTKSTPGEDNKERDISNDISFRKFKDEYINSQVWDQDIQDSDNGEWLKIVDNDGDGIAEYVFLTEYTLDKAVSSYTKSGETVLEFNSMDIEYIKDNDGIIDYKDEIAVGDVVYYTEIDNRFTITKAPVVKATIQTVSFKDDSCTTTDGETYTQSGIENESRLEQLVANLEDKVEYNLYFDAYGWLRAYELAQGNTYGLITELYKTTTQNVQYVKGEDLTVELKKGSAKIDEFDVENSKGNVFRLTGDRSWASLAGDAEIKASGFGGFSFRENDTVLLQPAIGQLGKEWAGLDRDANRIFAHPDDDENPHTYATTNVAVYTETADGEVRLTSPVKLAKDENGNQYYYLNEDLSGAKSSDKADKYVGREAYVVDYIALDLSEGVKADAKHYPISDDSRYTGQSNKGSNYVDAVHDTQFYVVNAATKESIDFFTDYEKVYDISSQYITAAYAVARNIESDFTKSDYWVADVIVIEVSDLDTIYDSIGLLYNNPSQTSGTVKRVESLNSESENPEIDMIIDGGRWDWNPRDNGNGIYKVDENEIKDGDLYADGVEEIERNFNANGIYAGYVSRVRDIHERGGYIDILMPGSQKLSDEKDAATRAVDTYVRPVANWSEGIRVTNDLLFAITSRNGELGVNTTARDLRVTRNASSDRLVEDHRVIWVEDKDGNVAFLVDVDFVDGTQMAPSWLSNWVDGLWYKIADEQVKARANYTFNDALKMYLDWQNGTLDEKYTKDDVIDVIKAAIDTETAKGNKDNVARLNEMLATLGGSTTGSSDLVEAWNTYVGDKTAANKAALYKLALEGTYNYSGTSDADKAFKAAVDTAAADLNAFTNAANGKKLAKVAEAKGLVPDTNAKALAAKNSGNNTAISNYDKAVTLQAENEKLYDKAKALVLAYNEKDKIGSATTEAMFKAFEAISDAEHTNLSDQIRLIDSGYKNGEDGYLFGVENGADYATAWEYVNTLYQDATKVGSFSQIEIDEAMKTKYDATIDMSKFAEVDAQWKGVSVKEREITITVNDRAAIPTKTGDLGLVYACQWLGLQMIGQNQSGDRYLIEGSGFENAGWVEAKWEFSSHDGAIVLISYGSDNTADATLWLCFDYDGPDTYTYTAELNLDTAGQIGVKISKEYATIKGTDITSITVYRTNKGSTDSVVKTVTTLAGSETSGVWTETISSLTNLATGDDVYAEIKLADGQTIKTATGIFTQT